MWHILAIFDTSVDSLENTEYQHYTALYLYIYIRKLITMNLRDDKDTLYVSRKIWRRRTCHTQRGGRYFVEDTIYIYIYIYIYICVYVCVPHNVFLSSIFHHVLNMISYLNKWGLICCFCCWYCRFCHSDVLLLRWLVITCHLGFVIVMYSYVYYLINNSLHGFPF